MYSFSTIFHPKRITDSNKYTLYLNKFLCVRLQAMKEIQKLRAEVKHLEKLTHTAGNTVKPLKHTNTDDQIHVKYITQINCIHSHV